MAEVKPLFLQEKEERDAACTLENFARYLYDEKPDVFDNFYQVKRLLELADRRFRAGGNDSLFDACTQSDEQACWAFKLHPRINAVLNPRGMEMLPLHKDGFVVQTLENCSDILLGPKDLYSLCLCLWILRHRCISKVVLDVSVVARYHAADFWRLLRVNTDRLDAVELRGLLDTPDHFAVTPDLCGTGNLSELILVDITLTPVAVEQLCGLLDHNKGIGVLALRNVLLDTSVDLLTNSTESTGSHESDVGEDSVSSEGSSDSVAGLGGFVSDVLSRGDNSASQASSSSEDCNDPGIVHSDTGCVVKMMSSETYREPIRYWTPLFRRLEDNKSLTELEISGQHSTVEASLPDLARALLVNRTLKHLAVQVCLSKDGYLADWLALTKSIGQNRGLESVSFPSSSFGADAKLAVVALRTALEENVTLQKVSMAGCGLSCSNVLLLFGCLEWNTTLKELHVDAVNDPDFLLKLRDAYILDRVEFINRSGFGGLCTRTDLKKKEPVGELNFRFTRTEDLLPMFAELFASRETVSVLSFEGTVPITDQDAKLLSCIIPKCGVLERVSLLFPSGVDPVCFMMEALAQSDTVSSVVVGGGWQLTNIAAKSFEHMLRTNTSIRELTIVQPNRTGFEVLKKHLRQGMLRNGVVSKLKLLYDKDRKESRDYEIMRMTQRNRIVEKRLVDMASRVRGDAGSLSGMPNLDVEFYTTLLGLKASSSDYAGLEAKLKMSKKLRQCVIDIAGRFGKTEGN